MGVGVGVVVGGGVGGGGEGRETEGGREGEGGGWRALLVQALHMYTHVPRPTARTFWEDQSTCGQRIRGRGEAMSQPAGEGGRRHEGWK